MIRQSTVDLLKARRFSGMATELERQLADSEAYRELAFEDRLAMLVDAEWNRRQVDKYARCVPLEEMEKRLSLHRLNHFRYWTPWLPFP